MVGVAVATQPAKLVVGLLSNQPDYLGAVERLMALYGPVDLTSVRMPFTYSDYYTPEFGSGLQRQFIAFRELIDPAALAEIKLATNDLESDLALSGKRRVNIDPGYLTFAKLVLATTKNQSHRIYLGRGIYAEVTLNYRAGRWQANPWTYPDYTTPAYLAVMEEIRQLLRAQLRG
ncbi:MAG: DUF4416 family protein [Chloroflexi bacterium]|nr:DUF4416 family protein [Chloroflexota bacterium]